MHKDTTYTAVLFTSPPLNASTEPFIIFHWDGIFEMPLNRCCGNRFCSILISCYKSPKLVWGGGDRPVFFQGGAATNIVEVVGTSLTKISTPCLHVWLILEDSVCVLLSSVHRCGSVPRASGGFWMGLDHDSLFEKWTSVLLKLENGFKLRWCN